MVYAPGHFQQAKEQSVRRGFRTRGERLAVRVMVVVTILVIAVTVYSLTNHQRTSGHGCIDFNYTTMIGGAETYACGAKARTLCATTASPGGIDGNYLPQLDAACRKAGIRVDAGSRVR